jgi:hypothetical protein
VTSDESSNFTLIQVYPSASVGIGGEITTETQSAGRRFYRQVAEACRGSTSETAVLLSVDNCSPWMSADQA